MKKGCFISVILVLTLVVLSVYYLVKFHGQDLLDMGKEKLIELASADIQYKIEEIKIQGLANNKYADSLSVVVTQYLEDLKGLNIEEELKRIEEFSDDIEVVLMDSQIDSAEFHFITNILTKYEKRKEN